MKIKNNTQHDKALARISELMDIDELTDDQAAELSDLADAVVAYEDIHYPLD